MSIDSAMRNTNTPYVKKIFQFSDTIFTSIENCVSLVENLILNKFDSSFASFVFSCEHFSLSSSLFLPLFPIQQESDEKKE